MAIGGRRLQARGSETSSMAKSVVYSNNAFSSNDLKVQEVEYRALKGRLKKGSNYNHSSPIVQGQESPWIVWSLTGQSRWTNCASKVGCIINDAMHTQYIVFVLTSYS